MRNNYFQNPYNNFEDNAHNYHHHESMMAFQGSCNNGEFVSGFDQTSDHALHLHPQGVSPIGLTLRKSNSLINLVEMTLSHEREQKKVESQPPPEKLKASNFPALILQIGTWKRISRNEGDLVAKIYYAKKKLVWEFLDGPLKNKIEVQWSEISAIRSFQHQGDHGRLEIEINQPPLFCREVNPQPRKHTQWKQTTDFTGGQASICRRHSIIFSPGVLDKQYEKLLQCDSQLFNLSQQSFPVNNYPFFYNHSNQCVDYPYMNAHNGPPAQFLGDFEFNLLMSGRGNSQFEGIYASSIVVQDQQMQTKMLHEDINSTGYINSGALSSSHESHNNYRMGIQECNSWTGVPHNYELPWESGMEDFGDLYRNHQYYPN